MIKVKDLNPEQRKIVGNHHFIVYMDQDGDYAVAWPDDRYLGIVLSPPEYSAVDGLKIEFEFVTPTDKGEG